MGWRTGASLVAAAEAREKPYRDIGWESVSYDGPDPRDIPPR